MMFVDTNVLIDLVTRDIRWFDWSSNRLADAVSGMGALTSTVVVAELARDFLSSGDLLTMLDRMSIEYLSLDAEAAFVAGKAFGRYRSRRGEDRARVLPDFFIGAHASSLGIPLLTRDPKLYRTYFPDLPLITPETHP